MKKVLKSLMLIMINFNFTDLAVLCSSENKLESIFDFYQFDFIKNKKRFSLALDNKATNYLNEFEDDIKKDWDNKYTEFFNDAIQKNADDLSISLKEKRQLQSYSEIDKYVSLGIESFGQYNPKAFELHETDRYEIPNL